MSSMPSINQINYRKKYLKYKNKYLELKKYIGGGDEIKISDINLSNEIKKAIEKYSAYRNTNESYEAFQKRLDSYIYIDNQNEIIGNLNFDTKLEYLKINNPELTIYDLIYCYSLNEQDNKNCKAFTYNDSKDDYDETMKIIPIKLKKEYGNRYKIIDGRHRIVAHILQNVPTIIAKIDL
jgi:coproporphyrinogen III oxidase